MKLLGVTVNTNLHDIMELNYVPKLDTLKMILRICSLRDMTPIGNISIVTSLALSQLIYPFFSVLRKPDEAFMKDLDTTLHNFIL